MFRLMAGAAAAALSINTFAVYNENFDAMDAAAATIPGWLYYDQPYTDDTCETKGAGYGPNPLDNRNYTTVTADGGAYFRAGLESGNDNTINGANSLRVYENFYADAATPCQYILVFKEFPNGNFEAGAHTFKAKMMSQKYATNAANTSQGMFAKVLDVANGYSETVSEFKPIVAPAAAAEQTLNFVVPDLSTFSQGAILQIGFYAQGPGNQSSGAMWDDVSLTKDGGDTGGGDNGGGDNGGGTDTTPTPSVPVPALPLGGLLGLIALVGWLGLRRRG